MLVVPDFDDLDSWWWTAKPSNNKDGESRLEQWSSLIGIITAIVGNMLIALALNVQRYSHIQLHKRRVEARLRAKDALRKVRNGSGGGAGYGATRDSADGIEGEDDDSHETHPLAHSLQSEESGLSDSTPDGKVTSTYLKSPSWWLGQVLMTVGEGGNFLAYGFAPASIVSPLGVVALISNCVIAPIFFGEVFRKRDFWGVVIAILGAVVVVLSANQEETKLEPHDIWNAISTMEFEVYLAISITLIVVLMWASPRYGNRTILIDLGLVGLFGAYTVLSTKGVSSMLSATLWRAFATPVTYLLVCVLLGTAIMQVRYVNRALQQFDSTQVIPIQFVLFTISVIIGSAVLYRDFERTTSDQAMKFFGGCLLTFFGVFLVTSGRPRRDDEDDDGLSDDGDFEETIGLTTQDNDNSDGSRLSQGWRQSTDSVRSSRRISRVSFDVRPSLTVQRDSGIPTPRNPNPSESRTSLLSKGSPVESSPLLNKPWEYQTSHPGLLPTFSDDSVATIHSVTSVNSEPLPSDTSLPPQIIVPPSPTDPPRTPRQSFSSPRPQSHHFSSNIFSPSPLSSTVSAVVGDALLRGEDGSPLRRRSLRRARAGLRSSLFVSQSDDEAEREVDAFVQPVETEPHTDETSNASEGHKGIRGRARSLSITLSDLFGRKRARQNTDPEHLRQGGQDGGSDDTGRTDAPP